MTQDENATNSPYQIDPSNSQALDYIDQVFFTVDKQWRFVFVNAAAEKTLGRSRSLLIGLVMWEAFPTLIGSSFEQFYRQTMAQSKSGQMEGYSYTTQSWYEVRAWPTPDGLVISFQDISARKQLQQSLEESEKRYQFISSYTFEGIMIYQDGRIVEANQAAAAIFAYQHAEDLIGLTASALIAPEQYERLHERIAASKGDFYETIGVRATGQQFPIEGHSRLIEFKGKTAFVIVFRDISVRKQAEEVLQQTRLNCSRRKSSKVLACLQQGSHTISTTCLRRSLALATWYCCNSIHIIRALATCKKSSTLPNVRQHLRANC